MDEQRPGPGLDYPRTFQEFDAWFAEEAGCRDYLVRVRWPRGFVCPRCGYKEEPWTTARGYLHCRTCQGEISPEVSSNVVDGRRAHPAISGCFSHFTVDEWDTLDDQGDELVAGESAPLFLRLGGQFEYHG